MRAGTLFTINKKTKTIFKSYKGQRIYTQGKSFNGTHEIQHWTPIALCDSERNLPKESIKKQDNIVTNKAYWSFRQNQYTYMTMDSRHAH